MTQEKVENHNYKNKVTKNQKHLDVDECFANINLYVSKYKYMNPYLHLPI